MTDHEALAKADALIAHDARDVYDAAAYYGQQVRNLPRRILRRLVADFLMEGC